MKRTTHPMMTPRTTTSATGSAAAAASVPDNAQLTTWLQAAGEGNDVAFRRLSQALAPRLHALAYRLLSGDVTTAQDVLQDVLVKLWQTAPRWQPGGSVAGYASRLVYTTVMDHFRRQHPTISLSVQGPDDDTDSPAQQLDIAEPETVTGRVQATQERSLLLGAIRQLPERQQEAVVLSYFHDHNQKSIAAALETTEKAVESLLVRARRTLATLLPAHLTTVN